MIVISDASPLIALAAVGQIDLLQQLYRTVLVPDAVHQEVTTQSPDAPGAAQVRAAEWVRSEPVRDRAAAVRLGRRVVGVLGILIEAKHARHLAAVKPVLDALEHEAGFRIGRELYARVLASAGE